jgi:uncharacterized protein (DUF58 family)
MLLSYQRTSRWSMSSTTRISVSGFTSRSKCTTLANGSVNMELNILPENIVVRHVHGRYASGGTALTESPAKCLHQRKVDDFIDFSVVKEQKKKETNKQRRKKKRKQLNFFPRPSSPEIKNYNRKDQPSLMSTSAGSA